MAQGLQIKVGCSVQLGFACENRLAQEGTAMAKCEVCGNDYDKAFTVTTPEQEEHTFDSFECAIHALAPDCAHCGCKVVGHGVEQDGTVFCCVHCAQNAGVAGLRDRA
jgi:hypothetical protein